MPKRSVAFIKPPEPAFIKRMKDAIGYQEPPTVETKKQVANFDDDDTERDDEKPVVVVLKPGDLTEEEVKTITEKADENKRIVFSKPVKKDNEEKNSLDFSSKKKEDLHRRINTQREKTQKVKNSSLLSFDEEEDY